MGLAGSGAAGVALLCHVRGARVDGCDSSGPSPYTPPLAPAGIRLQVGHDPRHLADIERLAITPAVRGRGGNAELAAAERAGIPVVTWQAVLGELMAGHLGVAVTGTHGKSNTTALLGHLLIAASLDPTVEVGAFIPAWGASVRPGGGAIFVVEADEFGDNFLNYPASAAIVTNVEMDHPDFFADESAVLDSFTRFVHGLRTDARVGGRLLLVAAGDPGNERLLERVGPWAGRVIRYASAPRPDSDVAAESARFAERGTTFTLFERVFEMSLAGEHNVANAVAALTLARELGAPLDALVGGLRTFEGAGRRMEWIADVRGVSVFDDYAHHPTEVRAAIAAARQKVGGRRLWAVFEPHMYSRTALLMDEFSRSFAVADEVVIADIFASRDTDTSSTSAERLADAVERVSAVPALATGGAEETAQYVADHVREGDAVLVMGAGLSYRIARGIVARLAEGVHA